MSVVIYCIYIVPADLYITHPHAHLSEEKILRNAFHKDGDREILVELLWQTFKYFKYKYIYIYI